MFIVAVLCLCAAVAIAGLGVWLLTRPRTADPIQSVLRGVAPTQLAAAAMLASAGTVALSSHPDTALVVVVVCVIGAVSTVAAGCWQAAKVIASREAAAAGGADGCGGACATCTLSCG
ncbi:hypothetical protein MGALJ_43230 [Mycobacterium gallinarum]|uniref:Transmembrane protein n=1 Tax=Mycobacterium gallinarum TaxID=39689 RepID=A0A9W4B683_9MYCO|nr:MULTISPECIES: hypothetical protein [Mycobacterium]MDV3131401.1 hypothetical protein [Mycobacterium sp. 29Ha]BBY94654.1 hypothetical protein MGALJ_43230 [Mycobacterium gallinarum]